MQSRNKIKLFFEPKDFLLSSELIVALCLPDSFLSNLNSSLLEADKRFKTTKDFCNNYFEWCNDISKCDFVLYPQKFIDASYCLFNRYLNLAKNRSKILLAFQIDDCWKSNGFDSGLLLYKTSIKNSQCGINVRSMPAFVEDRFDYTFQDCGKQPSVGFCGHKNNGRDVFLAALEYSKFHTNFIVREGFWAPEVQDKERAVLDFDDNIRNNLFSFCHKGAGNFSYRFYEIMMHGRLPFIINTDCKFPFIDRWKSEDIGYVFSNEDKQLMIAEYDSYIKSHHRDFLKQQIINRNIYETFFSPEGFIFNLYLDLKEDI